MAAHPRAEYLAKGHCESNSELELDVDKLEESAQDALANVTEHGSGFKVLRLRRDGQLGDILITNVAGIVARSKLRYIEFYTRKDEGRVRILESIQWEHLRELAICLKPGTVETAVMRALVDGVKSMSGKVDLEDFWFLSESGNGAPLSIPQGDLLQTFVASTSLERLRLGVAMTLEQVLSLFRLADFTRLKILTLWTREFDSVQVDALLDGLQHAMKLETLRLLCTQVTDEQVDRMKAKGIHLTS